MSTDEPGAATQAPQSAEITAYDEAHFVTYLRLLDASAVGVAEEEMCMFGPRGNPSAGNLATVLDHLQRHSGVRLHLKPSQLARPREAIVMKGFRERTLRFWTGLLSFLICSFRLDIFVPHDDESAVT